MFVSFDMLKCTVTHNGEIVLIGIQQNGLYVYRPTSHGLACLASNQHKTRMDLFHARMGHINYADLRRLTHMSYGIILDDKPETELCKSCIITKSHRKHFNPSDSHAKHFGELTHFDICSVGIETIVGGFTQFILFIDDYSRYMKCYLIKNKSEALKCIKHYDSIVHNETGKHCQFLRSDNAKEFLSTNIVEYAICMEFVSKLQLLTHHKAMVGLNAQIEHVLRVLRLYCISWVNLTKCGVMHYYVLFISKIVLLILL